MSADAGDAAGRLVRLAGARRAEVRFFLDGIERRALSGDTVLSAVLSVAPALRRPGSRTRAGAGFCLMGACQDCWIWREEGPRLRACSTMIEEGMRFLTDAPGDWPATPDMRERT